MRTLFRASCNMRIGREFEHRRSITFQNCWAAYRPISRSECAQASVIHSDAAGNALRPRGGRSRYALAVAAAPHTEADTTENATMRRDRDELTEES